MKVSIIITNHNYGRYLGRAIQSCHAQRNMHDDLEIIVVDDGSTDNTRTVLESYSENVRTIFHEQQRGLPAAINTGIRATKGQYVIRLDADDWLDRHTCFLLSYFLDHNKDIGFVWPDYYLSDVNEKVVGRSSEPLGAGIMFRKQLLVDIGLYDEDMRTHEDRDILIRCMEHANGYHMKMPLYRYFLHDKNMTNDTSRLSEYHQRLLSKHSDDPVLKTLGRDPGKRADLQEALLRGTDR